MESRVNDDSVTISISDQGPGIPDAISDQLFDPFFTTKQAGEGTGLGLSITKKIISSHGGRIEARNAKSGGALFQIHLPAHRPERPGSAEG